MTQDESILTKLDEIKNLLNFIISNNKMQLPDKSEYEWADNRLAYKITGLGETQLKKRRVQLRDGSINPDGIFRMMYDGAAAKYYIPDLADYVDEVLEQQNKKMNKPKKGRFDEGGF